MLTFLDLQSFEFSILLLLFKITVVLAATLFLYRVLKNKSAQLKHSVLATCLILMPIVVVLHFREPTLKIPIRWDQPTKMTGLRVDRKLDREDSRDSKSTALSSAQASGNDLIFLPLETQSNSIGKKTVSNFEISRGANMEEITEAIPYKSPSRLNSSRHSLQSSLSAGLSKLRWVDMLILTWAAVAGLLISVIGLAWATIVTLTSKSTPIYSHDVVDSLSDCTQKLIDDLVNRKIYVKVSPNPQQFPLGAGFFFRTIIVPEGCRSWSDSDWRSVLLHELAHFERNDWVINLVARIHQAVFWFHPLIWMIVLRLQNERELACDNFVIGRGVRKLDYVDTLLKIAQSNSSNRLSSIASVAMNPASLLESRVKSVLCNTTNRHHTGAFIALMFLIASIFTVAIAIANLEPVSNRHTAINLAIPTSSANSLAKQPHDQIAKNPKLKYMVHLESGEHFVAEFSESIEISSSFGSAKFLPNQIQLLKKQSDDANRWKVESDGSVIYGRLKFDSIELVLEDGTRRYTSLDNLASLSLVGQANLASATIVDGFASNKVSYHIRAPQNYDPKVPCDAIVILHGPEANSRSYIEQVARNWPEIAARYLLIGINGENRSREWTEQHPKYNYTYVNFMGRSRYKGFPGTEKESPGLVAAALTEISETVPINRLFLGGHMDGAWLTYLMYMHFPEMLDGAFVLTGAQVIQCEPSAFVDLELIRRQKQTPLSILHSKDSNKLRFRYAEVAFERYQQDGFPMVSLLADKNIGDEFAESGFDLAIDWLETACSKNLSSSINKFVAEGNLRDAIGLMDQITSQKQWDLIKSQFEFELGVLFDETFWNQLNKYESMIGSSAPDVWLDDFLQFRCKFAHAYPARTLMRKFEDLRRQHDRVANELWYDALKATNRKDSESAKQKYEQIVTKYFASRHYRTAKKALNSSVVAQ